jgi:glucose/mannose-6-phosphate isomerase
MFTHDKTGFKQLLLNFHMQIDIAEEIVKKAGLNIDGSKIKNILYLGMGGSAIAGDLLNDVFFNDLKVPLNVIRSYSTPNFCNENTLVITSSYSGDTEETLSAMDSVIKKNAQVLAITSGGKMAKVARENKCKLLELPGGFPPRQALGLMFFSLYKVLGETKLVESYIEDLSGFKDFIFHEIEKHDITKHGGHVLAQELAKEIHNKIPVIYSSAPHLSVVSKRWQNQMHENSKSLAFCNVLPEMNHNEIVGWEMDPKLSRSFIAVFLENQSVVPRIKERIELSKAIIKKQDIEVVDIYSSGNTVLEKVFSLIILGDWVSYYLALLNEKDPIDIRNIDFLKQELAKTA